MSVLCKDCKFCLIDENNLVTSRCSKEKKIHNFVTGEEVNIYCNVKNHNGKCKDFEPTAPEIEEKETNLVKCHICKEHCYEEHCKPANLPDGSKGWVCERCQESGT